MPVREEPGSMVPRYVLPDPGTSDAQYPRNQEPVVLGTQEPGTGGALYPRKRNQWCSEPQGILYGISF